MFSAVLCAYAETTFTYSVKDGCATITGAKNIGTYLDIPDTVDGYPVVEIGARAFNFELDLEYLRIPSGVTNICRYAFSLCHGMEEIVIPDSVETIEEYAFYKCYGVERIEIGSGVKTIEKWAFGECYALEELCIKHGVEKISRYSFGMCYSLGSITLPSSVKSLQWGAFAGIPALEKAYIPVALKDIMSDGAFEDSPRVSIQYYNCKTPVAPQPVFDLTATEELNGRIRVTWKIAEETEVSSFQIYRAMRPHLKKAKLVAEVSAGEELVYEDTDVSSDYTYCYWVKTINDIFNGSFSEVAVGYCEDPQETGETAFGVVPELTETQVAAWISEDLAVRYASSDEGVAGYQSRFESKFGSDPVAAMTMPTGKKDAQGNDMYVWQDYVAGTDPTDTNSVFTAKIEMVDGAPVITWSPELSPEQSDLRTYTIYGKANIEDESWHSPTNSADRFFRVDVEMR